MYEFDEDTRVIPVDRDRFEATLSPRWNIGTVPNGGYVMAVAHRAMEALLPHPDLLTLGGHYLAPTEAGPAMLEGERIRVGKGTSTGMIRLVQEGRERARFIATAGHFDDPLSPDDLHLSGPPEMIPPRAECVASPPATPGGPSIRSRFDACHAPLSTGWMRGEGGGAPCSGGHIRFADGRPPDLASLPLFADAYQPTLFNHVGARTGWVPTLQLTLQYRARPVAGDVRAWFETRHLTSGLHEEDGQLWDADGTLVALSRQLARMRVRSRPGYDARR